MTQHYPKEQTDALVTYMEASPRQKDKESRSIYASRATAYLGFPVAISWIEYHEVGKFRKAGPKKAGPDEELMVRLRMEARQEVTVEEILRHLKEPDTIEEITLKAQVPMDIVLGVVSRLEKAGDIKIDRVTTTTIRRVK